MIRSSSLKTRVPSVEELRRLQRAREAALELGIRRPDQAQVCVVVKEPTQVAEKKIHEVEKKVNGLIEKVAARARRTPMELREALLSVFERDDFSPVEELYGLYKKRDDTALGHFLTADQRIKILSELTSYVLPKLRTVEHSGRVEHSHKITVLRFGEDGKVTSEPMGERRKLDNAVDVEEVTKNPVTAEVANG